MDRIWVSGAVAGLISAMLFMPTIAGNALSIFTIFASLPLFFAGFGWSWRGAAVATGVGVTLVSFATGSLGFGFAYLLVFGAAPMFLTALALTYRQTPDGIAWYPGGHLLGWIAGLAAALFLAIYAAASGYEGGLLGAIKSAIAESAEASPELNALLEDTLKQTASMGVKITRDQFLGMVAWSVPSSFAVIWILAIGTCALAGQWFVQKANRAIRPPFDLERMEVPSIIGVFLAAGMALALIQGAFAFAGSTLATIFAVPFFVTGLVTIHTVTSVWFRKVGESNPGGELVLRIMRMFILLVLFISLQSLLLILICILGLVDQRAGFRRRALAASSGKESL